MNRTNGNASNEVTSVSVEVVKDSVAGASVEGAAETRRDAAAEAEPHDAAARPCDLGADSEHAATDPHGVAADSEHAATDPHGVGADSEHAATDPHGVGADPEHAATDPHAAVDSRTDGLEVARTDAPQPLGANAVIADSHRAADDCCLDVDPSEATGRAALRARLLEVAGLSEIFKVLGDETRTRIVYLLSLQEVCVHDIAAIMEMSLPAVSHHLRLLKLMRLVKHRRQGKNVFYSLDDHHILDLIRVAKEHYDEDT